MKVPSIIEINESKKKIVLKLFNKGTQSDGWFTFNFTIGEKLYLEDDIIAYLVTNNVGNGGYVYLSPNHKGGLFIDINNFYYDGIYVRCWMQSPYKVSN